MAGEQAIESAFAYHEPPIDIILNQSGLLIVLNLVNVCLDKLVYCGLIGQLFIGILWGTPGAKWLDREMETFIQQLGYLGLIMLVYEGGLSTSIKTLRANMLMSLSVAITGICAPMGLSFILVEMVDATPVQAFAAGAALSATSLGTTFTILSTTQLISTRLGIVTTSAAMLDDVVGLVMVKIISNLGGSADSFTALTVIRPVFVSIGFGVGCLLLCLFIFRPILRKLLSMADKFPRFMGTFEFAFIVHTCILVGVVGGATYAGTSSLFAAYLVGVMISWFDSMAIESRELKALPPTVENSAESLTNNAEGNAPPTSNEMSTYTIPTGERVYEKYYKAPVQRILIPLFFVSILSLPFGRSPQYSNASHAGINWVCNPYHGNVSRPDCVARYRLCDPHVLRKVNHRTVARPGFSSSVRGQCRLHRGQASIQHDSFLSNFQTEVQCPEGIANVER